MGRFWEGTSKKQLWGDICAKEEQIALGADDPDTQMLIDHIYDLTGQTIPRRRIERNIGLRAHSPAIQDWIDKLLADESDAAINQSSTANNQSLTANR